MTELEGGVKRVLSGTGRRRGFTLWLTGLSGAGKTTIAHALSDHLATAGCQVEILDGDVIRPMLSPDLGYSRADREENTRRIGYVARLLSRNGIVVIVAAMSPIAAARNAVRRTHESPFIEVHVECPIPVLLARDPKGLYARAITGNVEDLTGVSHVYEATHDIEMTLDTATTPLSECVARILEYLAARALLEPVWLRRAVGAQLNGAQGENS